VLSHSGEDDADGHRKTLMTESAIVSIHARHAHIRDDDIAGAWREGQGFWPLATKTISHS